MSGGGPRDGADSQEGVSWAGSGGAGFEGAGFEEAGSRARPRGGWYLELPQLLKLAAQVIGAVLQATQV